MTTSTTKLFLLSKLEKLRIGLTPKYPFQIIIIIIIIIIMII